MGTNFYLHQDSCGSCGRSDRLHIGKRSGGWEFTFQAYEACDPVYSCREVSPFGGVEIKSRKAWEEYIDKVLYLGNYNYIADEYGTRYAQAQFWKEVDDTRIPWGKDKQPLNHYDYVKQDNRYSHEGESKDADGWSFSTADFS